jgi:hypothetical protein
LKGISFLFRKTAMHEFLRRQIMRLSKSYILNEDSSFIVEDLKSDLLDSVVIKTPMSEVDKLQVQNTHGI